MADRSIREHGYDVFADIRHRQAGSDVFTVVKLQTRGSTEACLSVRMIGLAHLPTTKWVMGTVIQRAMLEPESLVLIRGFCRWT